MCIMDNPECTSMSVVKVEDELKELKQEPISENAESEFVQVDDSLSVEETSSEHGMVDADESIDHLVTFSEDELAQCGRPFSFSKVDMLGQRRRLRFSEADDMLLLRRVATLNPYKCSALWKEVTLTVAMRAGKNFSVRSIRDHTDLLMNTFTLRGAEACLRRTPPGLWEKKKHLLQMVQSMWKKDSSSAKSSADSASSKKKSVAGEHLASQNQSVGLETPKSNLSVSKNISIQPSITSSASKSPSVPLLMQLPNVPVKLPFNTPVQPMMYSPMLTSSLPSSVQQLELQKLALATSFSLSALGRPGQQMLCPTPPLRSTPDVVTDAISSDLPLPLISNSSSSSSEVTADTLTVDQSSSRIPPVDCSTENLSIPTCNRSNDSLSPLSVASVDSNTPSAELQSSEQSTRNVVVNRRQRISSFVRARLNFSQKRHRDQLTLRRRELELEKRRIALDEKKLCLEERKLQLEEEKWFFEKREREERLLMMAEERENKMAMERRQQNMIDILLELRKKE